MHVADPSGRNWTVTRRLIQLPRWRGFGDPDGAADGVQSVATGDSLESLVIGLLVVVALAFAFVFVWPLVVLIAEFVLAIGLVVVRLLFGRWTVVAETTGERRSWRVRGHRESARFAAHLADVLRTSGALPVEDSFESTVVANGEVVAPVAERTGHVRVIRR
jgi:hypothetical protein